MARIARGQEVVDSAMQVIANAVTVEQLRQAQAVILPLRFAMSLKQTAEVTGVSVGWVSKLVVGQIKHDLEQALGRPVSLSSVYTLLHRHDWRKLAPDKRHPQSDPAAQDEWKKNSSKRSKTSAKTGKANRSD